MKNAKWLAVILFLPISIYLFNFTDWIFDLNYSLYLTIVAILISYIFLGAKSWEVVKSALPLTVFFLILSLLLIYVLKFQNIKILQANAFFCSFISIVSIVRSLTFVDIMKLNINRNLRVYLVVAKALFDQGASLIKTLEFNSKYWYSSKDIKELNILDKAILVFRRNLTIFFCIVIVLLRDCERIKVLAESRLEICDGN